MKAARTIIAVLGAWAVVLGVVMASTPGPLSLGVSEAWGPLVAGCGVAILTLSLRWNRFLAAASSSLLSAAFFFRAAEWALAYTVDARGRAIGALVWGALASVTFVLWAMALFPRMRCAQ